jgi:hypothetical protein
MDEEPLQQSKIRCVFYGGPLDGRTRDVAAHPDQAPPEWIDAENTSDTLGAIYRYVKDGPVEERRDGRYLRMRFESARVKQSRGY